MKKHGRIGLVILAVGFISELGYARKNRKHRDCIVQLQDIDGGHIYRKFASKRCRTALSACRSERDWPGRWDQKRSLVPTCRVSSIGHHDQDRGQPTVFNLFVNFPSSHPLSKNNRGHHYDTFYNDDRDTARKSCRDAARRLIREKPWGIVDARCRRA